MHFVLYLSSRLRRDFVRELTMFFQVAQLFVFRFQRNIPYPQLAILLQKTFKDIC
jgi:hypothetical protein